MRRAARLLLPGTVWRRAAGLGFTSESAVKASRRLLIAPWWCWSKLKHCIPHIVGSYLTVLENIAILSAKSVSERRDGEGNREDDAAEHPEVGGGVRSRH